RSEGSSRIPGSFPDGTSNTILLTERYGSCTVNGDSSPTTPGYAPLWGDPDPNWRPVFCVNNLTAFPPAPGYPPCSLFQVQPNWLTGCDGSRAQSPHPAGIQVTLGDASVRFVSGSISAATWAQACDPRDGAPLGSDW